MEGLPWSTNLPSEPGYYWAWDAGQAIVCQVVLVEGRLLVQHQDRLVELNFFPKWVGPIGDLPPTESG